MRLVPALLLRTNQDILHAHEVAGWLTSAPLHVYAFQDPRDLPWPYPPGYFPVLLLAEAVHRGTGAAFAPLVRLVPIAANLVLVWLVDGELARRATGAGTRRLAAGVLLLSPLLVLECAWHGQVDLAATALAVGGVVAWERLEGDRRAIAAGLLIGAAAATKTVPGIVLLALVPVVAGRRELGLLVGCAVAVPALLLAPYVITDAHAVLEKLGYHGLPGLGGLSVLVQPRLSELWLNGRAVALSGAQLRLQELATPIALAAVLAAGALVLVARPRPAVGAVLLLLAVDVASANVSLHYLVWLVPFLLLAGWVRGAAALQVALAVPVVLVYVPAITGTLARGAGPWSIGVTDAVYVPSVIGLWAVGAVGLALLSWSCLRARRTTRASATPASG